jgi:hypothetical protein
VPDHCRAAEQAEDIATPQGKVKAIDHATSVVNTAEFFGL